jgi:hypothetical protein
LPGQAKHWTPTLGGGCSTDAATQTSSVCRSVSCTDVPPPGAPDTWAR